MNDKKKKACEDCIYYVIKNEKQGKCVINPPVYNDKNIACFPWVFVDSWCGKFRKKSNCGFDGGE